MMANRISRPRSSQAGIYIHVPFCLRKCNYCAFLSAPASAECMEQYVQYLLKEIALRQGSIRNVDTVFFGGGTPSLLTGDQIKRVLDTLKETFVIDKDAEITMEANPATLTAESLKAYRAAGINRLSMGVQSFHDDRLKVLGRIHNADDAKREFKLAREAGFDNINIDLMFSIPGSSVTEILEDLQIACELGPEHISFYSLQLEEGTPFFDAFERGELQEIPDDIDREMYHRGCEYLVSQGYEHYEISNFGKSGHWSRHNYKYWCMNEYLGLGLGASSYTGGYRSINVSEMDKYMSALDSEEMPYEENYKNTEADDIAEASFTGLRRAEGILFSEILGSKEAYFGYYKDVVNELLEFERNGYLIIDDEDMRLTERGVDVSNKIMALLV